MPENSDKAARGQQRSSSGKLSVLLAAILAVVQACLTIEGRGIEGFILWVLILFAGYWLLFTLVLRVLQKRKDRG